MSFLAQSKLVEDPNLIARVAACVSTFGEVEARLWAARHMWVLSASPGWAVAYEEATINDVVADPAGFVPHAGADPDVITDTMILTAVQKLRAEETTALSE